MCTYNFNISIFPGNKVTCDKEFYHYFCSDILCVCVCGPAEFQRQKLY